jgi:hypothetical protein
MKVLLRRILETPLHGRVRIDLHLGQKPKLGGGTPMIHSSIYHILSVLLKVHLPSCVVLVINDNLYGLMFFIEFNMKEPSIDNA